MTPVSPSAFRGSEMRGPGFARDKSLPASQVPFISKPLKAALLAVKLFSLGRILFKSTYFFS